MDTGSKVTGSRALGPQGRSPSLEELARFAEELLEQPKAEGLELVGPDGLLAGVTKRVVESALDAELTEHLGYGRHGRASAGHGNARNGKSPLGSTGS